MCGIFGFLSYGEKEEKGIIDLNELTESLAVESSVRGTDATGIAYVKNRKISIVKQAKPAYQMRFKVPQNIRILIGHTRHTTQGDEKNNQNNHPFFGRAGRTNFALTHNGIIYNDTFLRNKHELPIKNIETDSYVAVQLIEKMNKLNKESLTFMSEEVCGSFTFALLDDRETLYIVKGDSPVKILHFPEEKFYAYASTEEILWKALVDSDLFHRIKLGEYEEIEVDDGEILQISKNGKIQRSVFTLKDGFGLGMDMYRTNYFTQDYEQEEISEIKSYAASQGYTEDEVDYLLGCGFTVDDLIWGL